MAKNDVVLLDSILSQTASGQQEPGEVFEQFVLDQVLKNYDLSTEEINSGWTDGSADGGIDGFYVFVNGRLVTDPTDFPWPRTAVNIEVFLITCKHHATFQQAPLDAMLASVQELFDLSRGTAELSTTYSQDIRRCREVFTAVFRQLSLSRPALLFNVVYASRGDASLIGDSITQRATQLTTLLRTYFSACNATFSALGASELVEIHRHVKSFALDLPVQECLTAGQEGYVVLARLQDYRAFVSDENGELRRYLFDSNVRAYLGSNLVNTDISQTLADSGGPNFWWLNNGVTILATDASLVGKTLKLKDIQIVNGLQTTECIHRHYAMTSETATNTRTLLIKVIVSQQESVRDQVIRATNNQSLVEPAALHATDRIQRDIEEILIRYDWYYERRTNFFKNEGRPESRIIAPLALASGAVALLLKNPVRSSKLKYKHFRSDESNQAVYSAAYPLDAWPVVAALIRGAESAIARSSNLRRSLGSDRLSAWRGPLAYIAAVRLLGTCSYQLRDLASLEVSRISDEWMSDCWSAMLEAFKGLSLTKCTDAHMTRLMPLLETTWHVSGHPTDGRRNLPPVPVSVSSAHGPRQSKSYDLPEEFLAIVNSSLPPQPWRRNVHIEVATLLGAPPKDVTRAIKTLIARGKWLEQRDGVLFDASGKEVARDERRSVSK